jgi:hypothetical protein
MADRFASGLRLGYGPEIRLRPSGFHLAMDTLPSPVRLVTGPPGLARLCLRFPLARVRRDFHPLEKRPAGRTTLIRHYFETAQAMSPAALGNGTLPRGPLRIPEGDDSGDPYLPPNCLLRCPRLPVSPPSLITYAVHALSD